MKKIVTIFALVAILTATHSSIFCSRAYSETDILPWEKWHPQVEEYLYKTIDLTADIGSVISSHGKRIHIFMLPRTRRRLLADGKREIAEIGKKINSLKPPLGLAKYHKKIVGIWNEVNNFYINNPNYSNEELKKLGRNYLLAQIEIVKKIKNLFIKHGAPINYIENQNLLIKNLKEKLGKY